MIENTTPYLIMLRLFRLYEHCVAETEESVSFGHGFLVRIQNVLSSRKRRNKHYKRRFGKVEIGNKAIKHLKFVSGINEYLGVA